MPSIATPPYVNKDSVYNYTAAAGEIPGTEATAFTISNIPTNLGSKLQEFTHLSLRCNFTKGSLTNVSILVYVGDTDADLYSMSSTSTTAGVSTVSAQSFVLAATGKYEFDVPVKYPCMRVTVLGSGTATGGALTIKPSLIYKP